MKRPRYTDDDGRFDHVDLRHTNLSVTFARIRRKQAAEEEARKARESKQVVQLKQRKS